ncbi:hypothetical protein COLO4_25084 [Corchorus olitorius]|uniref:Bet v I/Major latex protein domain-containing protein n=1 Tax=Corchorus olitorius TaxID=93759 RepID=A0A1R3I4S1_9ROSI|nr:hypothetical protein COLO4_25084 [Corchorus olitorius]
MALVGKLEAEVDVKVPADKLLCIIRSENHRIPEAASNHIHTIEVHEGDWETHGSIKLWTYTIDGKVEIFKEKLVVDEANKRITMEALEGHVLEELKSYKMTYQVLPKTDESCMAKITVDYEKLNENVPEPNKYLQFVVNVTKDIESHLLKA